MKKVIGVVILLGLGCIIFYSLNKPSNIQSLLEVKQDNSVLPSSFFMTVLGDFTSPMGGRFHHVVILSSGGDKLMGEAPYSYSVPGTDGYLEICEIKNEKWVHDTDQTCSSLARLATTRTRLIEQIAKGELRPIQSGMCRHDELCYEFSQISE